LKARRLDRAAVIDVIAMREVERVNNVASSMNHASIASDRWRERLGEIAAPALVIHGAEDPVLPYGHGVALAREIPGATLLADGPWQRGCWAGNANRYLSNPQPAGGRIRPCLKTSS
jgi:pimeloyl-ACP methyl ester carboxylesterase